MIPNDRPNSSPQPFQCPNCGAGLVSSSAPSITCDYCGSTVLVPPEYRVAEPVPPVNDIQPIVIRIGDPDQTPQARSRATKGAVVILGVILMLMLAFGLLAAVLAGAGVIATTRVVRDSVEVVSTAVSTLPPQLDTLVASIPSPEPTLSMPSATPLAYIALQFGGEGSGPGQFDDPRQIAVDGDGDIYVADYNTGRVQAFDPQGKFQRQIQIGPNSNGLATIFDLAVDYDGQLYVLRGGDILVIDTASGVSATPILANFPTTFYNALAIDPANILYAVTRTQFGGYDIVQMDGNGQEIARAEDIIRGIEPDEACECNAIAVDGLGKSYMMSVFDPQVFVYSTDGNYLDRLGSPGSETGQLEDSGSLAIDGQGRVYILDSGAIEILDQSGAPLDSIPWDYSNGSPRDLTLDLQGNLYVVTSSGLVFKFSLNWAQ